MARVPSIIARVIVDALIINLSMFLAFTTRYLWYFSVLKNHDKLDGLVARSMVLAELNAPLLTVICLLVFAGFGFYTRGRVYQSKYKLALICQASLIAFCIHVAGIYLLNSQIVLPRSILTIVWLLTTGLLIAARLSASGWNVLSQVETHLFPQSVDSRPIRKVLLIGGAGYIGSALLPKLLEQGYKVRILDLLLYGLDPIKPFINHPNVELIENDFRKVDVVVQAVRGIDAVVHLGAIVGDPACEVNKDLTIEVNLEATRMIAEVAKGSHVARFIFASTCSVYGASDEFLDERSRLNPVSLYARSKIASERVLLSMANPSFLPTILRFGTIYGFSGRTRFDLVVNLLVAKAIIDKKITVINGHQWRPFLHVDDAASSILTVIRSSTDRIRQQVFNVGSNKQNLTIHDVGKLIQVRVPDAELVEIESEEEKRNYRVDFTKIERELGFRCTWTVQKGIEQVMDAIKQGHIAHYTEPKYSNVKVLRESESAQLINVRGRWIQQMLLEEQAV